MKKSAKLKIFSGFLIPVLVLTGFFVWTPAVNAEWADHVVISEILFDAQGSDEGKEFIELYNPTDLPVSLYGWSLKYTIDELSEMKPLGTFSKEEGNILFSRNGFFLVGFNKYTASNYQNILADVVRNSYSLPNGGDKMAQKITIILSDKDGKEIDRMIYDKNSIIIDGQSLERKAYQNNSCVSAQSLGDKLGNGCDTDNLEDFEIRTIPNPQNSQSPAEPATENPPTPTSSPNPTSSPEININPPVNPYIPPQSIPVAEAGSDKETIIGESVDFDGSDSFDPQGKELTFSWNFGDEQSGQGENTQYVYNLPGEYAVVLKVTNGVASGEDSLKVKVSEPEFSDKIILSEILPDPKGLDKDGEWIELANTGDKRVNLRGWILDDRIDGGGKPYTFKEDVFIEPQDFLVIKRRESGLVLPNKGGELNLLWYDGKNLSKVFYGAAKEGRSYALINGAWQWIADITPEEKNILSQPVSKTANKTSSAETIALVGKQNVNSTTGSASVKSEEVTIRDEGDNSSSAFIAEQTGESADSQEKTSLPDKEGNNTLENNKFEINSKSLAAGELGAFSGLENSGREQRENNNKTKNNPWFWGDMALSALSLFLVWRYQELKKRIKEQNV